MLPKIRYVGKGFIAAGGKDTKGRQLKGLLMSIEKEMLNPEGGFILQSCIRVLGIKGTYEEIHGKIKEMVDARYRPRKTRRVRKKGA